MTFLTMHNNRTTVVLFFILFAAIGVPPLSADHAVNINTATLTQLKTLDGVGDVVAQSIVDNRPYAAIEEVSRASGIGAPGSVSYEKIKNHITVGTTQTPPVEIPPESPPQTQTQATQTQLQSQSANEPPSITVSVVTDKVVTAGGGSYSEAAAYTASGQPIVSGARYIWNFGDGTVAEGKRVFHTYHYPGRYVLSVTAAYNYSSAMSRTTVEARDATVSLGAEGDGSLLVYNLSDSDLDVGLWSLQDGGQKYVIPEHTFILANEGVRFAAEVTGLLGSPSAELQYPNGVAASSAVPGQNSPLRGERVPTPAFVSTPPPTISAPTASQPNVESVSAAAALGSPAARGSSMLLTSLVALAGLLTVGVAGIHYSRPRKGLETPPAAEEFDIE